MTTQQQQFILENYKTMPVAHLHKALNLSTKTVYAFLKERNLEPCRTPEAGKPSKRVHPWQGMNRAIRFPREKRTTQIS